VLNLDVTDRRRLAVAAALTIVALPAIWLFARSEPSSGTAAPSVAGAAGVVAPQNGSATTPNSSDDPFGSGGPIFVNGPSTPPKAAVVPIVVPETIGQHIDGRATYKHNDDLTSNICVAPKAPFGAKLLVTNLDNGRTVTCINRSPRPLATGLEIQLTTVQFQTIAQLVDAPVPVRIQWMPS
jgi:hypothetical protein